MDIEALDALIKEKNIYIYIFYLPVVLTHTVPPWTDRGSMQKMNTLCSDCFHLFSRPQTLPHRTENLPVFLIRMFSGFTISSLTAKLSWEKKKTARDDLLAKTHLDLDANANIQIIDI